MDGVNKTKTEKLGHGGNEGKNQHEFLFVYVDFEVLHSYICIPKGQQKERDKKRQGRRAKLGR